MLIMLEWDLFTTIVFLAIGIGFLASLFGIGGGFLLNPSMILLLYMQVKETVGTSAFIIMFMSLSSIIAYMKQKRIDYKIALILSVTNLLGSILGAYAVMGVSAQSILIMFGVIEAGLAIILGLKKTPDEKKLEAIGNITINNIHNQNNQIEINKNNLKSNKSDLESNNKWYKLERKHTDSDGNKYEYTANILIALPLTFIAGFLSSLLGIGGGTLYIQIFVFFCAMSIHMAIASSMFMIFWSAIVSTITFASLGQINYSVGIAFAIGMVIGAQLGARVSKKIEAKNLKKWAAILIVIIAIRMIYFAIVESPV